MPVKMRDMAFLAEHISDNLSETDEGFLIAHNVPIARTGIQAYYGREIGLDGKDADKEFKVYRLAEDVFSEATLRSFEGKPVSDNHPEEAITADNCRDLHRGHGQNIRTEGNRYIVADLMITDKGLIQKVKSNIKRQVSAGYDCDYVPYKDGYRQTNIRANHIAVVERGRAGPRVTIKDEKSVSKRRKTTMGKREEVLGAMLKSYAQDDATTGEDLAAAMALFAKDADVKPEPTKDADKGMFEKLLAAMTKDKKETADTALAKDVAELKKLVKGLVKAKDEEEEKKEEEKTEDEEIEKMLEDADPDEEEEKTEDSDEEEEKEEKTEDDEPEAKEEEKKEAQDAAMKAIVRDLKPVLAKMPEKQRKQVLDSLAKSLKRQKTGVYAEIVKTVKKKVADAETMDAYEKAGEEGRKIMATRNIHLKKA